MKLTISSNDWWHSIGDEIAKQREEHPTIIHQWWDGLEWRAYELPHERTYNLCTTQDLQQMVCELDYFIGKEAERMGLEGFYRFINYHVDVIQQGFDKEWQNILELAHSWTIF